MTNNSEMKRYALRLGALIFTFALFLTLCHALLIGSDSTYFFNGTIDEIKIYNYSLSEEQISANYQAGISGYNPNIIVSNETSVSEEWLCSVTPNDGYSDGTTKNSSSVIISSLPNTPPDMTSIALSPTSPNTLSNIQCTATATDAESSTLTVEWYWYNGTTEKLHGNTTVQVDINTLITTLGNGNTTKGEKWNCTVRAFDGALYSGFTSANATILNTLPTKVILHIPTNSNDTLLDRTPDFIWYNSTDPDNDTLTYNISITNPTYQDINVSGITTANYTPATQLQLDSAYNWTVQACDNQGCGPRSDSWNFSIMSVSIIMINGTVDFGTLNSGDISDTTNDTNQSAPKPFVIENQGNVNINISVFAQNNLGLWVRSYAGLNTSYFQSKAGNSSEPGSFNFSASQTDWINIMNESYKVKNIVDLNYSDTHDLGEIEIRIRVPADEPPGAKSATLVFEAVQK